MKRRSLQLTVLSVLAVVILGSAANYGVAYWTNGRFIESTANAYVRGDIVAVAPKVSGYVVEVAVNDNQFVDVDHLLFRLDPQDYEARLAQSVATLNAARAARESVIAERALQEALIGEADAALAAARAEETRAARDRRRADNLVAEGWTTHQRHDIAVATAVRAQASVAEAEAGLTAQRQRLAVLDAEAVRLDAAIEQAAAQVRLADIALDDATVRAPIAGVVGNRHVEVGLYARPGAPLLAIVPDDVWVVANFRETQLGRMAPGQAVAVWVDTFGGREFSGRIESLAPASGAEFSLLPPDNATGNFVRVVQRIPVKITLENDATRGLRPGMSAEVRVDTRGPDAPRMVSLLDLARATLSGPRAEIDQAGTK